MKLVTLERNYCPRCTFFGEMRLNAPRPCKCPLPHFAETVQNVYITPHICIPNGYDKHVNIAIGAYQRGYIRSLIWNCDAFRPHNKDMEELEWT